MSEFGQLNYDEVKQEQTHLSGKKNGQQDIYVTIARDGSTIVRLLPPIKGRSLFYKVRKHYLGGKSYNCPKKFINGSWDKDTPCPLCDRYYKLWKKIDALERKGRLEEANMLKREARALKPVERYLYNCIVRQKDPNTNKTTNVGPKVLSIGATLHQIIITAIMGDPDNEEMTKLGDVTDLQRGYDFVILSYLMKDGDREYPRYERSRFSLKPSPAGTKEEIQRWKENVYDLQKVVEPTPLEVLNKALEKFLSGEEDDDVSFGDETTQSTTTQESTANVSQDELLTEALQEAEESSESLNAFVNNEVEETIEVDESLGMQVEEQLMENDEDDSDEIEKINKELLDVADEDIDFDNMDFDDV